MRKSYFAGILAVALLSACAVRAQSIAVPQVTSIGPTDLFQDVVRGAPMAGNVYASGALLGNYGPTLPGNNSENYLIGGDATTNLWQRATTGASVTTTTTYGGPDRWAYWSGTSTAMTVSRSSTAADIPVGVTYGFKMARTSGQTGVVQVCMAQTIESANSYSLAGQTAELDFTVATGSNFSGTGVTAYISYGTATDDGVAKQAYGINAGGGGGAAWTGQVNKSGTFSLSASSGPKRVAFAAAIPSTATEVGVALCFTPVGTASTNDYATFSQIQLTRNSALTTAAGTSGVVLASGDSRIKAFAVRSLAAEALLQYRYFYAIAETATITPRAFCHVTSANSVMQCSILFPTTMRIAPTATYVAGFAGFTTTAETTATNCSALAIDSTVVFVNSPNFAIAACTLTSSTIAVGLTMTLVDNSGSGSMKYNSEL